MSRHTIAVCDRCKTMYWPEKSGSHSYLNVESTGVTQFKFHAELCITCSYNFKNLVEDFIAKRAFTTRAEVSVGNESVPGCTVLKVANIRRGEDVDG